MKLLLYCTKTKPYLYGMYCGIFCDRVWRNFTTNDKKVFNKHTVLNGKIIGECDFEVEEINVVEKPDYAVADMQTKTLSETQLLERSCLSQDELYVYLDRGGIVEDYGYAIHIKNLVIYDKPRELSELSEKTDQHLISKAPQNMMYCWDNGEPKVLISIRPEWLCKILNGEKTIEVRRKVLKEMM